jgi:hypothetical protein
MIEIGQLGMILNGLIWTGLTNSKWFVHHLVGSDHDGLDCVLLGWLESLAMVD